MFVVYVLCSKKFQKIYVGYTTDLENRLLSHNFLATNGWTVKFRPWTLIHQEYFDQKSLALIREKQLKSAQGRKWIWQFIKQSQGSYPPAGGREFDPKKGFLGEGSLFIYSRLLSFIK